MQLNDMLAEVPNAVHPVYWKRDHLVKDNLKTINRWIGYYTPKLPPGCFIDEAAVMVPSPWHVEILGSSLREVGWENFNNAEDLVFTSPFGTRYLVEYHFYRHPEVPYRLEIMTFPDGRAEEVGFSPLHASLWKPRGSAPMGLNDTGKWPVPHLSFKPKRREDQTIRKAYGQAVQHLQDHACAHAQTCQSTYGAFGYYIGNDAARSIYIKPRINTRDEG